MKRLFLDSSVFFTAVNSPTGGSAKLFTLHGVELVTSKVVLKEVERNVRKKLQTYHLERFFLLAEKLSIIDQKPDHTAMSKARRIIVEKDAIILAEAKKASCDALVTLDRKHFMTEKVKKFLKPKEINDTQRSD